MEFDPSFQGQFQFLHLSTHFPENPTSKPQVSTIMFPSQCSNNPFFQSNKTTHIMNMPTHSASPSAVAPVSASASMLMEGAPPPSSSMTINPFHGISSPCVGQPSLLHQAIPSNESLIRDFTKPAIVNFAPENNAFSHEPNNNNNNNNTNSAKIISDFSQKNAVIPTQVTVVPSSSSHPPPPPVSGGHGSMLRVRKGEDFSRIKENDQRANGDGKIKRQHRRTKTKDDGKSSNSMIKGQWTLDEDRTLKQLVNEYGLKKWSQIAELLNGRIGKQCRERWYNHLQPDIRKGPWTLDEDIILIKAHKEVGNKWAKIAKRLPGRTENTIKNRWNSTKRGQITKSHKNTANTTNGSPELQAYINEVIATEKDEVTKKQKNESIEGKAPMFSSGLCNTDIGLMLHNMFPNYDFSNEAWAAELFDAPTQGNGNGTTTGSVVNGGNAKVLLNGEKNKREAGNQTEVVGTKN